MLNIFNMDNFNEPGEQTENNDEYTHGQHTKSQGDNVECV